MTVVVPPVSPEGLVQATTDEGMLDRIKEGDFGEAIKLHNKVRQKGFVLVCATSGCFLPLPECLLMVCGCDARRHGGTSF